MITKRWSTKSKIIATIFAAPCLLIFAVLGILSFIDSIKGPEGLEILKGNFHILSEAFDPVSGLKNVLIVRKTQMLQYDEKRNKYTIGTGVETVWSESQLEPVNTMTEKYENPAFPEDLQSEVFYGTAEIGSEHIPMSKWLLSSFRNEDPAYVGEDAMIAPTGLPDDMLSEYGLVQVSPGRFVSEGLTESDVGCIVVEYSMLNPALNDTMITALAKYTEDGEFGTHDDTHLIYTRDVSEEEIRSDFQSNARRNTWIYLAGALISLLILIIAWI